MNPSLWAMRLPTNKIFLGAALMSFLTISTSFAALNVSAPVLAVKGGPQGSAGSIELTNDLTFQITDNTATGAGFLVFQGLDPLNGSNGSFNFGGLVFQPNTGALQNLSGMYAEGGSGAIDNSGSLVDIASGDIAVLLSGPMGLLELPFNNDTSPSAIRTVTLSAFSEAFADRFTPVDVTTQSFTGFAFLADGSGKQISDLVLVPEPSAYAALVGMLALSTVMIRRRQRRGAPTGHRITSRSSGPTNPRLKPLKIRITQVRNA